MYVFIVSFLTELNSGAVYRTFILYRQLHFVNKGGKTFNFRFLNQINDFNVEIFCFALKILCKCSLLKPVSHQPCGSPAPICDETFLGFVRQPHGVVNNTARLPYKKQDRKAAATNFRHVHFLCDLFAFSER